MDRRVELLGILYGPAAAAVARQLDAVLDRHRRPTRSFELDQRQCWVIAYPDHVTTPDEAPLHTLDRFVSAHLAPEITGIHTLPLHPASSDGGFSVIDPLAVEPAFGTWDDIDRLAAHHAWMGDAVVNHLSAQSPWFRAFLDGDPDRADFFVRLAPGTDTTSVVRPRTTPLAHVFAGREVDESVWTTFSADQVDLDYRNPAVLLAMVDVLGTFVDHGAQAIRLDAIAFVWKDPATSSIHLPETHAIVQLLRACLDEIAPDVVLITETNVPHAENISYLGDGTTREADAVYQFALPPLVAHTVLSGSTEALAAWCDDLAPPPPGRTFMNFLASHDGIGLRPVEGLLNATEIDRLVEATTRAGGMVNERTGPNGSSVPYELAVSWFALMGGETDPDAALARHVAAHRIALALPGVPLLYFNSLFAVGNDTATFHRTGHARDLNRRRHDLGELSGRLADPRSREAQSWAAIRAELVRRRGDPSCGPGVAASVRAVAGGVVIDRGSTTTTVPLPVPAPPA